MTAPIVWISGFASMLVWLVWLAARARTRTEQVVSRGAIIAAAALVAALGFGSAYVWGIGVATQGMDRILAADGGERDGRAEPPRARLFLRHVQLILAPADHSKDAAAGARAAAAEHAALVGYSPEAGLRLPRSYGLDEAKQGWDLMRVHARGPQGLGVGIVPHPEDTNTRVLIHAERRAIAAAPSPEAIAAQAWSVAGRGGARCRGEEPLLSSQAGQLDGPGAIYAIVCAGGVPRAALVFERDLPAQSESNADVAVRITPLIWRGAGWRPHHVQIASGSLMQMGTMVDALPGVTLWEVPAPAGRAELFFPPENLLAACPEWLAGNTGEGFFSNPADAERIEAPALAGDADDPICVLPFTPPFGLEVRRLLPDVPAIGARSLWAAGLMTTPALLLLLFLCARPRSELSSRRFLKLLSLGWIAVLLAAVAVWRLLWAHRIDMLRDYEPVGARVLQNQVLLAFAGGALAATCVLAWTLVPRPRQKELGALGAAIGAWLSWLLVAGWALRGDMAAIPLTGRIFGQALVSLGLGTAMAWLPMSRRWLASRVDRAMARIMDRPLNGPMAALAGRLRPGDEAIPWLIAMSAMAGVLVSTLFAIIWLPAAVALKLALAWAFVLTFYAALRASLTGAGMELGRALATCVLGALTALMLARFDPGVTVAIAGPGFVIALLFASHDARFADASLRHMDSYRRHHAPLTLAHAALLAVLGVAIAVWAGRGIVATTGGEPDAVLSRSLTLGGIHLILFLGVLFVPAAVLAYLRRGARAAAPWLAAALLLGGIWLLREPLTTRVMSSSSQAANRIAIVLDPGYALLRSESKFLSGITAWRETIVPAGAGSAAGLWDGQGYFGAQLIDPGVLLSVENDYFPVLLLRETGVRGVITTMLLLLTMVAGLWILSGTRFRHGSAAQRSRALAATILGLLCLYQPLASLGALPLTGIAWPGLGLDSPSDFWLLFGLLVWMLVWSGEREAVEPRATTDAKPDAKPNAKIAAKPDAKPNAELHARLDELDRELRRTRLFRRIRLLVAASASIAVVAALLLLARASVFALRRPNPVDPAGRAVKPFDSLQHAVDYAYRLQCPWSAQSAAGAGPAESLIPGDLLGDPDDRGTSRFHASLRAAWQAARPRAVAELAGFLAGDTQCKPGRAGPWSFEPSRDDPSECRMIFKAGWPEVELLVSRGQSKPEDEAAAEAQAGVATELEPETQPEPSPAAEAQAGVATELEPETQPEPETRPEPSPAAHSARCRVDVRADVLQTLRFPARRPYRNARIRLVSRAMGTAARDVGEMVSGHLIVRLRPSAGSVDVSRARAGFYAGSEIRISSELSVAVGDGGAVLRRTVAPAPPAPAASLGNAAERETWLFMREPPESRVHVLEAEEGTWRLLPADVTEVPLTRLTLLVVGGPSARSLWLFRPPSEWPGEDAAVHPLIADDISTVVGERRRHYMLGGLIPEVGWVNPYHKRMSLGLDGWVHVAMAEYEAGAARAERTSWLDNGEETAYCGPSGPPAPTPPSASGTSDKADPGLARVCSENPLDGVLECRISLQPELAVRMRHLTELIALEPTRFGDARSVAPVHAGYTLMRGDTGEIVAQGELVPGRASTVYAPATPEIEQHLIRMREDRDPETGRKLPPGDRGEASAEKIEWNRPVAVGSAMKPLLGRALELADPDTARALVLRGAPMAGAACKGRDVHAILGHCPPTESLWNHAGQADMNRFLATSINWFQAAIGLVGTAVPRGSLGLGTSKGEAGDETGTKGESDLGLDALAARNLGDHPVDQALWTRYKGKLVIGANHTVNLETLRTTPMWQSFETVLGRPLCTAGSKSRCVRRSSRKDLCAARSLPIQKPTSDLRHLVALGPSSFDFYPELADSRKRMGPVVNIREYLQFLRGSGMHPLGSLAQLTDAFNRVVYEPAAAEPTGSPSTAAHLAASWFPVAPAGTLPPVECTAGTADNTVRGGLCSVLVSGTASRAIGALLSDPRFVVYGAKTGTIDSLADIAESPSACEHFRTGHTIADRPARSLEQPYWLPCGQKQSPPEVNDSLILISFAVRTEAGPIPLTLGLRFQRSGSGLATLVAAHYLELIQDYFAEPVAALPGEAKND